VLLEHQQFMVMVKLNQLHDARPAAQPRLIAERFIDGLIVEFGLPPSLEDDIRRYQIPTVWLNSRHQEPFDCVYPDEVHAGRLITEHLIAMGHRRIAYFQPDYSRVDQQVPKAISLDHFSMSARPGGYKAAMSGAGLKPEMLTAPAICDALPDGVDPIRQVLARVVQSRETAHPITAIVTGSLGEVTRLWLRAVEAGLQCPKDLSLATCSDTYVHRSGWPEITGVTCDRYQMGWDAAEMILAKVDQKGQEQPSRPFKGSVVPGQTSAAPRARLRHRTRPA
jgi:LacI family transcriptional regulator